jgi:hypothetical protein
VRHLGIFTLVSLCVALWTPRVAADLLLNALTGMVYFAPPTYDGTLYGFQGEWGLFSWHLAQWGIAQPLPDHTECLGDCTDGTWQTANAYGSLRVIDQNGHYTWELAHTKVQNGYACNHEVDLLAEPTVDSVYPGYPVAIENPALDTLSSLTLEATQQVVSAFQGSACPYPYSLASTVLALTFVNTTGNGQAFFYQVVTYDSRGWAPPWGGFWFPAGAPTWFGVSDDVASVYGQPHLTPAGSAHHYILPVYDRIRAFLQSGQVNEAGVPLDGELSHWQLLTIYLGSYINGEASITSQLSEVRLY